MTKGVSSPVTPTINNRRVKIRIKNVDNTEELPTCISFCSGYAGIERGLELAGVEHRILAYVEIEAYAIANLVSKMESGELDVAPIYSNLKTFPAGIFRGCVDLITGGYPCQPFSAAGSRKGKDDPRHLYPFIAEAVRIIRPGAVFFENVEGHISLGLNEVVADLEENGYKTTWGIFSASEVGAMHQRKRVYILGENAYADSTGLQRRLPREVPDTERREKQEDGPVAQCSDWGIWYRRGAWPPEPSVGRVVNGCSSRVDRIRLLGNGVVPLTAAKAYETLIGQP